MNNTHKKIIMLVILLSGCAATSLISNFVGEKTDNESFLPALAKKAKQEQKQEKTIRVYVSGAVLEPGLYDIPMGSRAEVAISAAGGMTEAADSTRVNLARKLKDGNQVNVPALKGSGKSSLPKQFAKATQSAGKKSSRQTVRDVATSGAKVKINSASVSELQTLPGIGPALAQRMVETRNQGRFSSVEDLRRVPGIGKAKLERLRAYVEVD